MNTEVVFFFVKAVVVIVGIVIAFIAIVYIGTFAITVVAGVLGLLSVKTKYPLMNPNGPSFVTALYAIMWATGITLALYIGSIFLNDLRGIKITDQRAQSILFKDAPVFFVQAILVLYGAARLARRRATQIDPKRANAIFVGLAAIVFSISSDVLSVSSFVDGVKVVSRDIASTVLFPANIATQLIANQETFIGNTMDWLTTTEANLFKLSSYISKILWIIAVFKYLKSIFTKRKEEPVPPPVRRDAMTRGETLRFMGALVSFSLMVVFVVISVMEHFGHLRFGLWLDNPVLTIFLVYVVLWGFLYRSRLQT